MSDQKKHQLTYFEKQRDALIAEIAVSMESVLNNVNALNRSLEGAIAVGKEFDSVSSLWANFYDGLSQQEQVRRQQPEEDQETQETEANEEPVEGTEEQQPQDSDQMDVDKEKPTN